MDSRSRDDINMRPIFQKLGHTLEEIRIRALQNLLSKLEHNMLCDADLVQEKHMHIRLLEWFNFPSCPLQEQTLSLIARMCKHPSAARIYIDIGAIEFVTQLRPNMNEALHRIIDDILDNLYHVPEGPEFHSDNCIVYVQKSISGEGGAHSNRQFLPQEFLAPSNDHQQLPDSTSPQAAFQQYPSPPDQQGYFGHGAEATPRPNQYHAPSVPAAAASCFKFSTFPWIPLTPTDRHVLTSTDTSLRNTDPSLVISACEFLSDVVFQDFPAEVFLQRPNIIKSLLSLLALPVDTGNVISNATRTLQELTSCLEARINYHQDPALYTPKQDFTAPGSSGSSTSSFLSHSLGSSNSRPSILGHGERQGGDGQDEPNSSSSAGSQALPDADMIEQTDIEDIQSLQFMQWTTPQYCFAVIEKLLPCLKTTDEGFLLQAIDLLHLLISLLRESVAVHALWDDNSVPARDVLEKFQDSLDMSGDILFLHHHSNLSPSTPREDIIRHRVAFVGISVFIVKYIEALVPADKVSEAIPKEYANVLSMIGFDETLHYSFPELREAVLEYLQEIDIDAFNAFSYSENICQSLQSTCNFLMESDELNDTKVLTLLNEAEDGMRSLVYHMNLKFVDGFIRLASYICRKTSPNPTAVQQSRTILLMLLAHPLPSVRNRAYSTVLDVVKDAMGLEHVTEPTTTATLAIVFVIDSSVLYEVCGFGMIDSEVKVSKLAEEIIICLLQSQLLLSAPRWQQLVQAFTPVLPLLQGFISLESTLGKLLLNTLDTDGQLELGMLPISERFRGTLRLMFSKLPRVRSEGLGRLAWFIANEHESMRKLPQFSHLNVENMANMMMVENARSLVDEDTSRSVFQVESLKKVYDIYVSDVVELSVRKSAAEQLAIILQDPCLHRAFVEFGGMSRTIEYIDIGVRKPPEDRQKPPMTHLLPAMIKMVRCVVQHDLGWRHKLAHQAPIYYMVLRSGLLHHKDEPTRREVAELLTLLLFDEVSSVQEWSDDSTHELPSKQFSLPSFLVKRYTLPVTPHTHHSLSPNRCALPPESDPLTSGTLAERLRYTWNVAWCGGVSEAIKSTDSNEDELFSSLLNLSKVERSLLEATYMRHALQHCVHEIENATGHTAVSRAVLRLTTYLSAAGPHDVGELLHKFKWREAISRFFLVVPSSTSDEQLLTDILELVYHILRTPSLPPMEILAWIGSVFHNHKGALLGLMSRAESSADELPEATLLVRRQLNKQLLRTVGLYLGRYPYSLVDRTSYECVRGDLSLSVLTRINRNNAAHFYNLASLESTLKCLMHVTARPGWSLECQDASPLTLCQQMLTSLLEVVSAFHIGRGGLSMSYMGRGITRSASVCLRHLAFEMASQLHSKDWPRNWLFSRQATQDTVGESGLHWLLPLWHYRDTEVRAAGVGIAAALASTEAGRITMTTQCPQMPGGIWGGALSVLLDQSECSIVRHQAALLLVNMTSQPMPSGSVESAADVWQGPIIRNEETQVSLIGLSALLALLHHTNFYNEMMVLLSNFYPQPAIHPVSVTGSSMATPLGSQATMTTSGSVSPGRLSRLAELSTSSQLVASTSANERPAVAGQHGGSGAPAQAVHSATSVRLTARSTSSQGVGTEPMDPSPNGQSQGPPDPGTNISGSVSSHGSGSDFPSVATPCLVSGVCQLLSNLVALAPQDTLASINRENMHKILISIIDVSLLDAYVEELAATGRRGQLLLAFQDLLRLHVDILNALRMCVVQEPNIRGELLADKNALKQLAKLLGISHQGDADTAALCGSLWEAVFTLLSALLQVAGQEARAHLSPTCVKQWTIIAGRTVSVLQDKTHLETDLWLANLQFLSLLLAEEGKHQAKGGDDEEKTITYRLDNPITNQDGDLFQNSSGNLICQALVRNYDSVVLKPIEQYYTLKLAVVNSLKSLLTLSVSAKMAALEAGLIETICEHIKRLTMKLNMEALELGKPASSKKKDNPIITELMLTFDMLRNFMYSSSDIKIAAYESGLSNLLHKVWAWCLMEAGLMVCVLALLATYTARCPQAASSLAFTSAMSMIDKPSKAQHTSTSLVHCIIKLVHREMSSPNLQLLKPSFGVLATLSLSQECMGILWKSNFLLEFSNLSPKKPKKSKAQRAAEGLWLDLLVNLSFSAEGQNMILKIEDSIGLLLEFGFNGNEHHQKCATIIIRNLCFHTSNKPKLLANDKLLPFLLRSLEVGSSDIKTIVCSGLLALVHNSQKAKGQLKNTHAMLKLQDAHNHFVNMTPAIWSENCAKHISDVLTLIRN